MWKIFHWATTEFLALANSLQSVDDSVLSIKERFMVFLYEQTIEKSIYV